MANGGPGTAYFCHNIVFVLSLRFGENYAIIYIESEGQKMKRNARNTIGYRVKFFFYRLTWEDIAHVINVAKFYIVEILTAIVIFLFLFFFPAFFH